MRVIDENGKNLGIFPLSEALKLAQEKGLDLVEISEKANPPVTKICNYGKFLYQKEKEERQRRAKERFDELKILRLSLGISDHDLDFKVRQLENFLEKYSKVQIELLLRGREKGKQDLAKQKLEKFLGKITKPYKILQELKMTPRGFLIIIGK